MESLSKAATNSFNALRLLAALQVAYIHATAHLRVQPLNMFGLPIYEWIAQFPGVPIFFSISGYLVFDSLLRLQSVRLFAKHRAVRIYPALAVNIAIMEIALFTAGQMNSTGGLKFFRDVVFYFFYILTASAGMANRLVRGGGSGYDFDGFFQMYPSGVLWTLTVELSFYAIIPLFLFAKTRASQTVLVTTLSILSLVYQKHCGVAISTAEHWPQSISVIPYFWMFGIGMLFRLWQPPMWTNKFCIPVLLLAFCLVAHNRGLIWFEWKVDPSASATVQSILLCVLAVWIGYSPFLKSTWLANNDMSYGLYLYHMLIVTALMNIPQEFRTQLLLLIVCGGGMLAGWLSWYLIERPAMSAVRSARIIPDRR